MGARPSPKPTWVHVRLRWLWWAALALVVGVGLWGWSQSAGRRSVPDPRPVHTDQRTPVARSLPSPAPSSVSRRPLLDLPTSDEPVAVPLQPEPGPGTTIYLPVLSVERSTLDGVSLAGAQAGPPLALPAPRGDVPLSLARASVRAPDLAPEPTGALGGGGALESAPGGPSEAICQSVDPGRWIWPVVHGRVSQAFSSGHRAIDVAADHGAWVVAADKGQVIYAEWEISGFGYLVIVDHGEGVQTYYAHLYGFYVDVGEHVARGDLLGQLGSTGDSTGPHLHFEIRQQGIRCNPLELLPQGQLIGRESSLTEHP